MTGRLRIETGRTGRRGLPARSSSDGTTERDAHPTAGAVVARVACAHHGPISALLRQRFQPRPERVSPLSPTRFHPHDSTKSLSFEMTSTLLSVKREQKVLSPYVFCSAMGKVLLNFERDWKPALQAAKGPNSASMISGTLSPRAWRWKGWTFIRSRERAAGRPRLWCNDTRISTRATFAPP